MQRAGPEGFEGLEGQVGEESGGEAGTGACRMKLLENCKNKDGLKQKRGLHASRRLWPPIKRLMRVTVVLLSVDSKTVGKESPEGSPTQELAAKEL